MLTRWLAMHRPEMRVHMATEAGVPVPRVLGPANAPIARYFARKIGADDAERVGALVTAIPAQLDRVDRLIARRRSSAGPSPTPLTSRSPHPAGADELRGPRPGVRGPARRRVARRGCCPTYPTMVPAGFVPPEWAARLRG